MFCRIQLYPNDTRDTINGATGTHVFYHAYLTSSKNKTTNKYVKLISFKYFRYIENHFIKVDTRT